MPNKVYDIDKERIINNINLLMNNLVNIRDDSGKFLLKLEDGRVIDTKGWNGWEWTHGIALYGLYKYYEHTGNNQALNIINNWFRNRFEEGTTTKNVNTISPFLTLVSLYEDTKNKYFLPYINEWFEWVMNEMPRTDEDGLQHIVYNNENKQQIWVDTLMMCVLPLAKAGVVLKKQKYIEESKKQFLLHIKYLADKRTGLWFHGWSFAGRHNFAEAFWARGNCWATISIVDFVELLSLDDNDPMGKYLLDTLRNQIRSLTKFQDKGGLWHTILDDESSYLEASATAGFAYGILKAVRKHYVDKNYLEVGIKALKGILNNISNDGELQNVSFGTPVFNTIQEYKDVPITSMPYGQALAILALSEFLNFFI
ncbi:glycosyl hydrolase family 88 [Thermoanaerobacterium thermosaccharolyticum]|uniref:beta-galactosidase BglB n=1 Tax=Thermoanaerobacterium thermosaccharolyticum TaxID=1517 RepID=UPI000C07A4AE|nr:glycoside hydrolase family 88 protein [Thermoanaerobacterium thermosaccharolyticum]MCP2240970.1 unsaturated rhamnogalacturonyl hydrolase [Thermoanaerobacterium thermosaccharolyticum]PHO08095.1 glycosyl hydrolase family 88 [Thermoanaerobacterium thermosaccharolyticum]